MFFGKLIFLFLIYFSLSSPIWSIDVQLSKSIASPGEPIIVSIKVDSGQDLQKAELEYAKDGVKAVYQGFSSETQIVNFKVYRSQVLNYMIQERREGKHSVPPIRVLVDGKSVVIPELSFQIQKGKQRPNPFGSFFGGTEKEETSEPPQVKFHTNKQTVYVNELLVGYFALYQSGMKAPFLERDPNHSISFPYFVSEVLQNITIEIPDAIQPILVYEKEIYGLTALKPGIHSLGKTQFLVGDSLRLGSFHEATSTEPTKVTVLPLPKPAPQNFHGAVGEYEAHIKPLTTKVSLGEPIFFEVQVVGRGGGQGISIPPPFQVIEKRTDTKFKSLESGENDFYSEITFTVSIKPTEPGNFSAPALGFSFFSPRKKSYGETSVRLPTILVSEAKPPQEVSPVQPISNSSRSLGIWSSLILFGFVFSLSFLYWKKRQNENRLLSFLDLTLGKKRGSLLGDFLQERDISSSDSMQLVQLRTAFSDKSLREIFALCDKPTKLQILSISKKLSQMESKHDNRRKR